ncbi:MAG: DUF5685 family protein [bacterium]|nr:DUF5685 family protein [bacterium]
MFGYVTINKPELKIKDFTRYRAYYCGLCRTLKDDYGRFGQMTLTYDLTFLIILLTSLYETTPEHDTERCIAHPLKKHDTLVNEITTYAADMNIALTYHHLLDDWEDEKSIAGIAGAKLVQKKYKKIAAKYERQIKVIVDSLNELKDCEQKNMTDLDQVARCFGNLMGEFFVYKQDEWQDTLREVGFYLGKFIYIIDAYEDLEKDLKNKSYNPLVELSKQPDYEEQIRQILNLMMADCTRAFEKLPLIYEVEILRNILYAGVWCKYDKLRKERLEKANENKGTNQ